MFHFHLSVSLLIEFVKHACEEHKDFNGSHNRENAWVKTRVHIVEFMDWFREKVKIIKVPKHLNG